MASVAAEKMYSAVRRFFEANGLLKALKAFDKETSFDESAPVKGKKAKALAALDLTEAVQLWLDGALSGAAAVEASDVYPAVRKFLEENELAKALKAFDKETSFDESAPVKGKKAKKLARLELGEAAQLWLDGRDSAAATNGDVEEPAKKKKRKASEAVEAPAEEVEEPPKKKSRKSSEAVAQEVEKPKGKAAEAEEADEAPKASDAKMAEREKKNAKKAAERIPGVPFKRIDDEKWKAAIKDNRLRDNTHLAKDKFGDSAGDSWGDKAAEDLLKVKGKGFRKEMAKKKRSSWRGGGAIDQGVNSIKFDDNSDSE